MNNKDLAYLTDEEWLKNRNKEWEQHEYDQLAAFSAAELKTFKGYCFTGNIDEFIQRTQAYQEKHPHEPKEALSTVIKYCPFNDLDMVLENIAKFWFWVLEKPEERFQDYQEGEDLDLRFSNEMGALFSRQFLDDEVSVELFFWLYGELFSFDRKVILSLSDTAIDIGFSVNIKQLTYILIVGLVKQLFYPVKDFKLNECGLYTQFIDYFLSMYSFVSKNDYSLSLPSFGGLSNNQIISERSIHRRLLCAINRFLTENDEDYGVEELICNDERAFKKLKDGIAALDMPKEFYELEEFVLKHKGESLYLSEG